MDSNLPLHGPQLLHQGDYLQGFLGEEADTLFDDGAVEVKVLHGVNWK